MRIDLLTPSGGSCSARHLQQAVHPARGDHGLVLPDPVDPQHARQLPAAADDRGARTWPSPSSTCCRWYVFMVGRPAHLRRAAHGRGGHGLDLLRRPSPPCIPTARCCWRRSGVFVVGFSSIMSGMNFIATAHMLRAPGMTWFRLPLFVWAVYATSLIMVLATPVLTTTLLLIIAERVVRPADLRPADRRRPAAVPAPVLVLQPPGRLHHGAAGHGRGVGDHHLVRAPARCSATPSWSTP